MRSGREGKDILRLGMKVAKGLGAGAMTTVAAVEAANTVGE